MIASGVREVFVEVSTPVDTVLIPRQRVGRAAQVVSVTIAATAANIVAFSSGPDADNIMVAEIRAGETITVDTPFTGVQGSHIEFVTDQPGSVYIAARYQVLDAEYPAPPITRASNFLWLDAGDTTYISTPQVQMGGRDAANLLESQGTWRNVYDGDLEWIADPTGTLPWGDNCLKYTSGDVFASILDPGDGNEPLLLDMPANLADFGYGVLIWLPAGSPMLDDIGLDGWENDADGNYIPGSDQYDYHTHPGDAWELYQIEGATSADAKSMYYEVYSDAYPGEEILIANFYITNAGGTFIPQLGEPNVVQYAERPSAIFDGLELRITNEDGKYESTFSEVQISHDTGPIVVRLDADDVVSAEGYLPDGFNWTDAQGRVWTVHGDGLYTYDM